MEITQQTLTEKLLRLPRRARIRFLHVYFERISPLFFTVSGRLLIEYMNFNKKSPFMVLAETSEIADKYCFNPHLYLRKDLEWARDAAKDLFDLVPDSKYGVYAQQVAFALEDLMSCCIDDISDRNNDAPYSSCLRHYFNAIGLSCSTKGYVQFEALTNDDLDELLKAMEEHHWTDDSEPRGGFVIGGWKKAPDGWPTSLVAKEWGFMVLETVKKLPFHTLFKLIKLG